MLIQMILYGLISLLLIGLSIPLMGGKVPPNFWYGFRTRLTLDNPEICYPVNAWAARRCRCGTLFAAALGSGT